MAVWSDLPLLTQSEIVRDVLGGRDAKELAELHELNVYSLKRKIRKLKQDGEIDRFWSAPDSVYNNKNNVINIEIKDGARFMALGDTHFGHHDQRACELVVKAAEYYKPDFVFFTGDILDCHIMSKFPRRGGNSSDLFQEELDAWVGFAEELMPHVQRRGFVVIGNHEFRYIRWLFESEQTRGLDSLDLNKLMCLNDLNIEDMTGQIMVNPKHKDSRFADPLLTIYHGDTVSKWSSYTAKREMENMGYASTITGHTHRLGVYYYTIQSGVKKSVETGCLCSMYPSYSRRPNWQHGFVYGTIGEDSYNAVESLVTDHCYINGVKIE